jgi:hypothetical protein
MSKHFLILNKDTQKHVYIYSAYEYKHAFAQCLVFLLQKILQVTSKVYCPSQVLFVKH